MQYVSTRNKTAVCSAAHAIARGLAADGGLMTPEVLPRLSPNALKSMAEMSYQQRAVYVMNIFLNEFTATELSAFATSAYGTSKFDTKDVAPVHKVDEDTYCLELWHGPTCAFKDMALQMLPYLLTASLTKTLERKTACILVATSGDTGKAALEGFRDVDKTRILVFYPKDGVSDIQKLQMQTQDGSNVGVCAVEGNFDDAQSAVKALFSDQALAEHLEAQGYFLSSANSINWGRVLPQIVYYISAYCDMIRDGHLNNGDPINVCVPTGNFGNILSAYYAKMMGVPMNRLICASNQNHVLTDFIRTGVYDRNRALHGTMSPSMDILISSNLERMLFEFTERSDSEVLNYMEQLAKNGCYQVSEKVKRRMGKHFTAGYCSDKDTQAEIAKLWKNHNYLVDTHTAVAFHVLEAYRAESGDKTPTLVVSTASPFKFCDDVLGALGVTDRKSGCEMIDQLVEVTGVAAPTPLTALKNKTVRFSDTVAKDQMAAAIDGMLV